MLGPGPAGVTAAQIGSKLQTWAEVRVVDTQIGGSLVRAQDQALARNEQFTEAEFGKRGGFVPGQKIPDGSARGAHEFKIIARQLRIVERDRAGPLHRPRGVP